MIIRPATPADIPAITTIYAHAVTHGTASFELTPPDEPEMTRLMNELIPSGIVGDTTSLEPLYPTAIEPTITSRPDEIVVDGRLGKGPVGEITFHLYEIDQEAAEYYLAVSGPAGS